MTIITKQKSQKHTSNWSNYNRTRLSFKAGIHEGACSWNTLPVKYLNQYKRRTRRGSWMMKQPDWGMGTSCYKKGSQCDWPTGDASCHVEQTSVQTRELAPETDSCNRFAPGACKPVWYEEAKQGSKSFVVQHIFSLEIVVRSTKPHVSMQNCSINMYFSSVCLIYKEVKLLNVPIEDAIERLNGNFMQLSPRFYRIFCVRCCTRWNLAGVWHKHKRT